MSNPYFREGQHYSFQAIEKELGRNNTAETKKIIDVLKKYYILKIVLNEKPEYQDLSDQDIIIEEINTESNDYSYVFTFVGVILLNDIVIKCYPKYIDLDNNPVNKNILFTKLKQIIKVIEKYNGKEQLISLYNGESNSKNFNRLCISLHILYDYLENGLYTNQNQVIETNGEGEILWDKTIDETFAFIKNNTPYYFELQTISNTQNNLDFIRRLHASIVTQCSKDLNHSDLLDLFELPEIEITDELIEDLGDKDLLKYKIELELKNQFITSKQTLLKTLYTYISELSSNEENNSFSLYGTNSFNLVWEKACGSIFDNIYEKNYTLKKLVQDNFIPANLVDIDDSKKSVKDFIEKPEWIINNQHVNYSGELIPDIIALKKDDNNTSLYILDGKYYLLKVENNNLTGNPGIQDVIKQYVYNTALNGFIDKFKIGKIANAFLIPSLYSDNADIDGISQMGEVPYWTLQKSGFKEIPNTQIIKIKPELVWENYLSNKILENEQWNCIKTSPTKNYLYSNQFDPNTGIPDNVNHEKNILVGFLRNEYFNFVRTKETFIFYFYATSDKVRYPMHPYIDFCTEFIGYSDDKDLFINGKLDLLETGRCKIEEIRSEDLNNLLLSNGFDKKTSAGSITPRTYYKIQVKDITVTKNPYNGISDFNTLEKMIKEEGLNQVLFKASPNVIHITE